MEGRTGEREPLLPHLPPLRDRLDTPEYGDHDQGFEAAYAVVRRLFQAMKDAMNGGRPPRPHVRPYP
ncbi:hypothetical protein GCM10022233_87520 [Streptomyces shaanxiensis]|uniref:Uncharacterized protein n=1 Tax=Streptomyces shaanxiensis TaxID=653357 RepID=A0ABP7WKI5_9ACTN